MPPRRSPRHATPITPIPSPQIDAATLNAAVAEAVATAMAQYHSTSTGGGEAPTDSTQGEVPVRQGEFSYKDFTRCQPLSFKGTEGVIALLQWFEKTESVFEICLCPEGSKVKFAACTFDGKALTWWNSHVKSLTLSVANSIGWENLKELMREEYCPLGEIQKLEQELWDLTMVGSDIVTYTDRFSELAALCPGMITSEKKKIERYIWGLTAPTQGNVLSSNPATFDSAKRLAQRLIDHGVRHSVKVPIPESSREEDYNQESENKRKKKRTTQDIPQEQQASTMYAATTPTASASASRYAGNLPKCGKCNFHHTGVCREMQCLNCHKKGHTVRYCRAPAQPISQVLGAEENQACYGCGETGHNQRDCPIIRNSGADGRILMITAGESTPESSTSSGTFSK